MTFSWTVAPLHAVLRPPRRHSKSSWTKTCLIVAVSPCVGLQIGCRLSHCADGKTTFLPISGHRSEQMTKSTCHPSAFTNQPWLQHPLDRWLYCVLPQGVKCTATFKYLAGGGGHFPPHYEINHSLQPFLHIYVREWAVSSKCLHSFLYTLSIGPFLLVIYGMPEMNQKQLINPMSCWQLIWKSRFHVPLCQHFVGSHTV